MSSSEQHAQGSAHSASSSEAPHEDQAKQLSPESVSSAGEQMNQQTDSTVEKVASQAPHPPERPNPSVSSPSEGEPQGKDSGADLSKSNPSDAPDSKANDADSFRQLPIPPASEPMQYRAIGLIRGKYMPSEEQFTRGNLLTDDGTEVDAVLLGRVMSLVKKHIDLEEPHLWVVYPRTRNKDSQLHAQIVGVWEPEKLNRDEADEADKTDSAEEAATDSESQTVSQTVSQTASETAEEVTARVDNSTDEASAESVQPDADAVSSTDSSTAQAAADQAPDSASTSESDAPSVASTDSTGPDSTGPDSTGPDSTDTESTPSPKPPQPPPAPVAAPAASPNSDGSQEMLHDGYFSIRGEITKYSPEENQLTVKIRQAPRKAGSQPKAFNLIIQGALQGRTVGYFWELDVHREGNNLVVQDGQMIRLVPPSKSKRKGGGGHPSRGPNRRGVGKPRSGPPRSNRGSGPSRNTPKPIRRNSSASKEQESSNGAPSSET